MPLHFLKSLLDRLGRPKPPRKINRRADPVGAFLQERTHPCAEAKVPTASLYEAYERWARIHGAPLLDSRYIARRLMALGHHKQVTAVTSGSARACWIGLALVEEQP